MAMDLVSSMNTANLEVAIESVIADTCFVDFGVVKKIIAEDVVLVMVSAAKDKEDYRFFPCVLLNYASKSIAVKNIPQEGDKVLIVYPRRYTNEMFKLDKDDVIYDENCYGYHCFAGLAILFNQVSSDYKNLITVEEGNVKFTSIEDNIQLELKKEDNKITSHFNCQDLTIDIDNDSALTVKNTNGTFSLDKEGAFSLKNNAELKIDKDGNFILSKENGYKIENSGNTIKINGHLEIK